MQGFIESLPIKILISHLLNYIDPIHAFYRLQRTSNLIFHFIILVPIVTCPETKTTTFLFAFGNPITKIIIKLFLRINNNEIVL